MQKVISISEEVPICKTQPSDDELRACKLKIFFFLNTTLAHTFKYFVALRTRLDRIEEILRGHDTKVENALTDLHDKYEEMMPRLKKLREEAVQAELKYVDLATSAAQISTLQDLKNHTKIWAREMNAATTRLELEVDAIESLAHKMVTYIHGKTALTNYMSEAVREMRRLHHRLQLKPIVESEGTQTDDLELSIDVSRFCKTFIPFVLFSLLIFSNYQINCSTV